MPLTRHALADHGAAEVDIGVRGPKGERLCWYECTVQGGRKGSDIDVVQLATSSNPNPNPNPDPNPDPNPKPNPNPNANANPHPHQAACNEATAVRQAQRAGSSPQARGDIGEI